MVFKIRREVKYYSLLTYCVSFNIETVEKDKLLNINQKNSKRLFLRLL